MGHTILLADDSITIQKVIELTFSDEDFKLHTVGNGQKAIDEIRTVKPDIVLCDIIMPEKNGYEVCEFIKSSQDLKHIPVLLLTGAFEPFDQERARKAGCDGFLAKPFEPQTLITKVKELLASAKRPAAPPAPPPVEKVPPRPAPPRATPVPPAPAPPTAQTAWTTPVDRPTPEMVPPFHPKEGPAGLDEGFAIEAGERELSVAPEDQTVLLGGEDTASLPGEDIWADVQGTREDVVPPAGQIVDDAATVFMAQPFDVEPEPPMAEPPSGPAGGFHGFAAVPHGAGTPTEEEIWELPSEEERPVQPAEPELTPLGDFGGFDSFSTTEQVLAKEPLARPPLTEPEPLGKRIPTAGPPLSELPVTMEQELFGVPLPGAPTRAKAFEAPVPPVPPPKQPPAPPVVGRPVATPSAPSPKAPVSAGTKSDYEVERPAQPPTSGPVPAPGAATTADFEELVTRLAEKIVARLSEKAIREIAWEVVPDMAETLIQKEIDVLKAKIPK